MSKSERATRSQRDFLQKYGDIVRQLPEPGEKWLARDVDIDNIEFRMKALRINGAVEKVGRKYYESAGDYVNYWQTCPHLYRLAHTDTHSRNDSGILPCGHDAIRNERGVDGITCGVCEEVHDRSEVDR